VTSLWPEIRQTAPAKLQLAEFAPFRLNRLAAAVSEHLSEIYRERFGLEIPEWRVLVTVGEHPDCTAQQVASSARLHKTRVSRAVAALTRRKILERAARSKDAREISLRLSAAGHRLYAQLVPLALERERALLSCMTKRSCADSCAASAASNRSLGLTSE
jgi:DNA-binding MarR family transcriptional regulator